jgi:hypothetical protein
MGGNGAGPHRHELLPARLVVRESCGGSLDRESLL